GHRGDAAWESRGGHGGGYSFIVGKRYGPLPYWPNAFAEWRRSHLLIGYPVGCAFEEGEQPLRCLHHRAAKRKPRQEPGRGVRACGRPQAVCLTGMPACWNWACNSPAWNISRTMSQPPMNSPLM